jgi:hypothetical protein
LSKKSSTHHQATPTIDFLKFNSPSTTQLRILDEMKHLDEMRNLDEMRHLDEMKTLGCVSAPDRETGPICKSFFSGLSFGMLIF